MDRLWQELQEMKPDLDKRGSKNNFLPSSTSAGSATLTVLIGWMGSLIAAQVTLTPAKARLVIRVRIFMVDLSDLVEKLVGTLV
jgi:hypothetical protein